MNVWFPFRLNCDVAVRTKKNVKIMSYEEMLTYAKLTQFERRRHRRRKPAARHTLDASNRILTRQRRLLCMLAV